MLTPALRTSASISVPPSRSLTAEANDRTLSSRTMSRASRSTLCGAASRATSSSLVAGDDISRLTVTSPNPDVPPVMTIVVICLNIQVTDPRANFIAHTTEDGEPLFLAANGYRGRVFEIMMNLPRLAGDDRANLFRGVTNRNQIIELLSGKFSN